MKIKPVRSARLRLAAIICLLGSMLCGWQPAALSQNKDKNALQKLHREARKNLRSGKHEKAVELYQEILAEDGQDLQALLGLSFAWLKEQHYQRSYDVANEALKIAPENARAHALLGMALLRSGYVYNAIQSLYRAFANDSKEALAYGVAAEIDYYEGRSRDAREKAIQAYNLDPYEPDYLLTLARSSSRLEMFAEAADAYEQFLRISPATDSERRDRIRGLIGFYRELAGVQVHQVGGPVSAEVPFYLGTDRRPYLKIRLNGREANFVVDTGSGFTVISKDAAKRFGVSEIARGGKSQGVGGDGKFDIVYGLIKNLHIGEVRVRSVPCFIRPFHGAKERPNEEQADGFIGLSVLAHFITELDYKDNVMRLSRVTEQLLQPAAVQPDVTVVPFRTTQNGLISVETELDDTHRINAILDSGASSTVISQAAVERLKMRDKIIKGQTVRVIGAAGISDNVELLFIKNCRVAGLQHKNMRALVLDFAAINETSGFEQSGILGGDFLRNFRVTIDFPRAQIHFRSH
ncbi:MAG TPA: aspartyl protease family protein [Blastocatellia bacterium]|nr:aspartyl protease family protein [Blastocatellia bacterium]